MPAIAAAAAIAMVAAACGGGDDDGGGDGDSGVQEGGTLVYGEGTAFPENLFNFIAAGNSVATNWMVINVLPAPFRVLPDFSVKADKDLVTEEPTSEITGGKQVVTYKLNKDAKWSDGDAIDVKDFQFNWNMQKTSDPAKGGCPAILSTTGYDQIESVEAGADDSEVVVTYTTPFADWQSLFLGLAPAHIMDKGDPVATCKAVTDGWPMADGIPGDVSGGPWQIKKANIDATRQVLKLVPNETYWGAKPHLEALIHQYVGNEPNTLVQALDSNEVQLLYPQPQIDLVKQIKELEPEITSETNFGLSFEHFDFNTRNVHLKNKEVREAFALALDRNEIVKATVGAFDNRASRLNNRLFVNNQAQYEDNAPEQYNERDIDAAKSKLESIGYTLGGDGIYVSPEGKKLTLEIMTTQNNPLRESTIDLAVDQLKEAGIEGKKFLNPDIFAGLEKPKSLESGGFDVALFAWVSSPFVSGNIAIYKSVVGNQQGQNYTHGNDSEVDGMLEDLAQATELEDQKQLGNDIDTKLWENMFTLPLYQKPTFIAYNSGFQGIQDNASNAGALWNSPEWAQKS